MKKSRKVLCSIIAVFLLFAVAVTAFAATGAEQKNSALSITVETDKDSYKSFGAANIAVTVTNTSNEDIQNVSAEAVFDDLTPVGRNSKTTAEAATLKAGESLSFSYKAMLNQENFKLNIFEKILAFFVKLFNMGYKADTHDFNDGRIGASQSDTVTFGKHDAENVIRVWCNFSNTIDTPQASEQWFQDVDESHVAKKESGMEYMNNRLIVFFTGTDDQMHEILKAINGRIAGTNGDGIYQIEIPSTKGYEELDEICHKVGQMEGVFSCQIEIVYDYSRIDFQAKTPNDPWKDTIQGFWGQDWDENNPNGLNWGLEAIQAPSAWEYNNRFSSINIGIADTGFDTSHEDLEITVINPTENETGKKQKDHGTHVSGIIGATANNQKGITGIVWNKKLFCADIVPSEKQETNHISILGQLDSVLKLVNEYNCKIVNFSIGKRITDLNEKHENAFAAINIIIWIKSHCQKDNFLIIPGAGNDNVDSTDNIHFCLINDEEIRRYFLDDRINESIKRKYSASDIYSHLVVVSSVGKPNNNGEYFLSSDFANYGDYVSIVAPGEEIFSTVCVGGTNGKYDNSQGTSMAAPMVTGVASLVWSVNPDFSAGEVKDIVCNNYAKRANGYGKDTRTYPLVNAKLAVEEALKRTVTGYIKESKTKQPVANATVTCEALNISCKTDKFGRYTLKLPSKQESLELVVTHDDYQTKRMTVTDYFAKDVNIELEAAQSVDLKNILTNSTWVYDCGVNCEYVFRVDNTGIETVDSSDSIPFTYSISGDILKIQRRKGTEDVLRYVKKGDTVFWGTNHPYYAIYQDLQDGEGFFYDTNYVMAVGEVEDYPFWLRIKNNYQVGDLIEFGSYPQSRVTDEETISALDGVRKIWKSYEYYSGTGESYADTMKPSDYMKYADFSYNGAKYRAVYFNLYRPSNVGDEAKSDATYYGYPLYYYNYNQANNGFFTNHIYYFKYEPITWRIISPENGYIMTESILDAQPYQNTLYYEITLIEGTNNRLEQEIKAWTNRSKTYYASNYEVSSIRAWLNEDFYKTAFNKSESDLIKTSYLLNNSTRESIYDSNPTYDRIFIPSLNDACNSSYGFSALSEYDSYRKTTGTEYAKCQGLSVLKNGGTFAIGNSSYWLRGSSSSCDASTGMPSGAASDGFSVWCVSGVRPACCVNFIHN